MKNVIAFIFLSCSLCFASFSSDLDTLAKKMAVELKLSPQRSVSITTFNIDRNYLLSLDPVFDKLKEKLAPYVKKVVFNPFADEGLIDDIIVAGDHGTIPMSERKVDSLLLTGYYRIYKSDSSKINFKIKISDIQGQVLFKSEEYTILMADCPSEIKIDIFDKLTSSETFRELQYRGRLITELNDLFATQNNNLQAYPREYRFEKKNPYALQWQVETLRDILSRKYNITMSNSSANTITIEQSESVVFSRDGKEYSRAHLVKGDAPWPEEFPSAKDTYIIPVSNPTSNDITFENSTFTTLPQKTRRDAIFEIFDTYYPALFNNFNYQRLDEIFFSEYGDSTILVGTVVVDDARTGREQIRYGWKTKTDWLNSLKKAVEEQNRRFCVKTSIMQLFKDKSNPDRFWAIVKQKWQTKDMDGNVVYQDNGFLLVNFDFKADNTLKDFKIYYRLWFYDYKYDDLELGIKRYEKLSDDIKTAFFGKNAVGEIDSSLKRRMMDYLITTVKTFNNQKFRMKPTDLQKSAVNSPAWGIQ